MDYEKSYNAMYKFLAWVFFVISITFYGITNVKALTYTDIGYVHQLSGVTGSVLIEPTYDTESGAPLSINRQQVVYTQIKVLNVYVGGYNFIANRQYQFEMEFPNTLLSYANTFQVYGNNNELCTLNYTNSVFNSQWARWNFSCPTSTNSIYLKIYNSNNSAIMPTGQWSWNYIYMRYTDTTIDSNTQDTDTIINNNNMNTDRIIDNQNSLINDCHTSVNLFQSSFRQGNVNGNTSVSTQIFDDINYSITSGTDYTFSTNLDTSIYEYQFFLNNNQFPKSASDFEEWTSGWKDSSTFHFHLNTTGYLGFGIRRKNGNSIVPGDVSSYWFQLQIGSTSTSYEPYGQEICVNRLDQQTDAINGLNDSLNDDDVDDATSDASDFFSNFNTNTFGLTSIITAPLNLIQSLTSSTCSELHLPLPYLNNKYLDLPCMSTIYSQYFGNFFTLYQTITYGIIAYWVCVRIFNQVKDFKNPEHDEIEVVDL